MKNLNKTLLKNGLMGLAGLNEGHFKDNVTHALAFKLNDSIDQIYKKSSKRILQGYSNTPETLELKEFVDFIDNFEEGKYQFKNNSLLNITESDISAIKNLFEVLSVKNREKMVVEIFQDSAAFKHHVDFYNQSKGLLN
jgi:hypothetical protein